MIRFFIPGTPVPQARPRFTRQGWAYEPKTCKDYKKAVAQAARIAWGDCEPLDGPVEVALIFVLPIPKSWPLKRRDAARAGTLLPLKKPDGDNLEKLVLDALTGVCWNDDMQICRCAWDKAYGTDPGVMVSIDAID